MPLPWKKLRISDLLADLRSPSKRRGSLIVETGFPASLIDLFVKNRDRLRKTSSKKHTSQRKNHGHRRRIASSDVCSFPTEIPARDHAPTIPLIDGAAVLGRSGGLEAIEFVDSNGSFANRVFAAILKAFVVVTLALSMKKLVVGITLSAFALLLLERVGKHMDVNLGIFVKHSQRLLDLIQTSLSLFLPKNAPRRLDKCKTSKSLVLQESQMLCDSLDQIETAVDNSFEEEIVSREEGAGLGCVIVEREASCVMDMRKATDVNDDRGGEALVYCKNQSRSSRIKSMIIKKCVPKKLRDLRKKKIKGTELEEEEDEEEFSERSSYFSIEEIEDREEDNLGVVITDNDDEEESMIPWSCEPPPASVEGREKLGRGRKVNGYQMLILIVLAGLVGGRIWAFVLTVVWCLALKTLGNPRAPENVPLMNSLVSI